jgi:hypothetical protein
MDRIRKKTIRTKMGMKKDILQEIEDSNSDGTATSCKWRTAELLDRLQNGTHGGKRGAADQSSHGRIGFRAACKAETSRMKNVLTKSSGGKT